MHRYNNIFLIEDNVDDTIVFINAIKRINNYIKYTVAYNAKDAINKLKIIKHLPDLIFVDINMPEMNGAGFLQYLKLEKLFIQIPVIILSTSTNIAEKVFNSGADGYLIKPVSVDKLKTKIEQVLKRVKEII